MAQVKYYLQLEHEIIWNQKGVTLSVSVSDDYSIILLCDELNH